MNADSLLSDTSSSAESTGSASSSDKTSYSKVYADLINSGSWDNGGLHYYQYDVNITNRSDADISDWNLEITIPSGTEIDQSWNCTPQIKDTVLSLTGPDYAKTISPGSSSQGIGLILKTSSTDKLTAYKLTYQQNGETFTVTEEERPTPEQLSAAAKEKAEKVSSGSAKVETQVPSAKAGSISPLHVEGSQLTDQDGNAVRLQGVSTHGLQWFPQFVNKDAFKTLRDDWHANVVRLAMYTAEGGCCETDDAGREDFKDLIDAGVKAATDLGMYVIIDWHILHDNSPSMHQDMAAEFFAEESKKYADYPNVIYEICNEPNGSDWKSDIKPYAETIIPIIRKNAPDSVIIVGTNTWSQDLQDPAADPLEFDNIMYALHFYAGTHKDDLRKKAEAALDSGLPVFISESSITDASGNGGIDYDSAEAWKKLITDRGLSYIEWSLANKDESSAILKASCTKTSGWTEEDLSETALWYREMMRNMR
ncbi:MAG: cellulase family glycosylhydrolase [Eubacterium sp.]|nr:cellulase family glycosylhydrolase [Eubacterium sp.]